MKYFKTWFGVKKSAAGTTADDANAFTRLELFGLAYGLPLALAGIIWLAFLTNWQVFVDQWQVLAGLLGLIILFSQIRFFMVTMLLGDRRTSSDGDMTLAPLWAGLLVVGPAVLWLMLLWLAIDYFISMRRAFTPYMRLGLTRSAIFNLTGVLLPTLIALTVYQALGGQMPISGLELHELLYALAAIGANAFSFIIIWLPFLLFFSWIQRNNFNKKALINLLASGFVMLEIPLLSIPFGVFAAGLLIEHGRFIMVAYFISLLLIALLAQQLSRSAENSRRQSMQLMTLEHLAREIIGTSPTGDALPVLLKKYIPGMFTCHRAAIKIYPDSVLLNYPDDAAGFDAAVWAWLTLQNQPAVFNEDEVLPWQNAHQRHYALLCVPVVDAANSKTVGGILIELASLPQPWEAAMLRAMLPALTTLASLIDTTLQRGRLYRETLEHQRVTQELKLAGQIQASLLPEGAPVLAGWQIAAEIKPARETSGDYYEFIPLSENRLGVLIADVSDKGLGAALYMALSRTLMLTFADQYPSHPAAVIQEVNQRVLKDARAMMFITAFYGVLDLHTGSLTYCNAGHNPPVLVCAADPQNAILLAPTGKAIGLDADSDWQQKRVQLDVGDVLLLYTDGISEACNARQQMLDRHWVETQVLQNARHSPPEMLQNINSALKRFIGNAALVDDMTMIGIKHTQNR